MNYFKQNNWLIILLVVLNLVTITFLLWPKRPPLGPPGAGMPKGKMYELFKEHLDLTVEQAEAFRMEIDKHKKESRPLLEELRGMKKGMIQSLDGVEPDTAKARQIISDVGKLHLQIDSLLMEHYLALHAICTPEQQVELQKVFRRSFMPRHGKQPWNRRRK